MADFLTLRQSVLGDLTTKVSTERVDRAICQALRYWRGFPTTFNRQRITLTTTANVDEYSTGASNFLPQAEAPYSNGAWEVLTLPGSGVYMAVPNPILEIRHLRVLDGTTPRELNKVSIYEMEEYRSTGRTASHPTHWAWWDTKVVLAPMPTGAVVVEGLAIVDLGTPLSKYTGGAWATRTPADGAALNTAYTNGWFTNAFEVLHYYTLGILYQNSIQGPTGESQAQACLSQAQAHFERLRDAEVKRDFPKTLAQFLPGMYL